MCYVIKCLKETVERDFRHLIPQGLLIQRQKGASLVYNLVAYCRSRAFFLGDSEPTSLICLLITSLLKALEALEETCLGLSSDLKSPEQTKKGPAPQHCRQVN